MTTISRKQIEDLARNHDKFCISIFIPTHKKGEPSLKGQDILEFKQQVKEVEKKLDERSLEKNQIKKYLKPLHEMLEDKSFWRHQSKGLAVFLSENIFEKFPLPISFNGYTHVSDTFFLKPLMPLFQRNTRFMVLALDLKRLQLYRVTEEGISEVSLPDTTPSELEEAVGHDYEENTLQTKSQHRGVQSTVFHGQGAGKDDRKVEILKFFREINKGVIQILEEENIPLVLAGLDYLLPIYKQANTYENLSEIYLPINPFEMQPSELGKLAFEKMKQTFEKELEDKKAQFLKYQNTSKTSKNISEVLPAAFSGSVDSLFIEKGFDVDGIYESEKERVLTGDKNLPQNGSLTNLAAIQVFLKGGKVYLLEKDQMPLDNSEIVSLNRY